MTCSVSNLLGSAFSAARRIVDVVYHHRSFQIAFTSAQGKKLFHTHYTHIDC